MGKLGWFMSLTQTATSPLLEGEPAGTMIKTGWERSLNVCRQNVQHSLPELTVYKQPSPAVCNNLSTDVGCNTKSVRWVPDSHRVSVPHLRTGQTAGEHPVTVRYPLYTFCIISNVSHRVYSGFRTVTGCSPAVCKDMSTGRVHDVTYSAVSMKLLLDI